MARTASRFIWYELMARDLDAAARFYAAVVGWTVHDSGMPGVDYRIWHAGEQAVGGMMAVPGEAAAAGMPPAWFGYLHVPDVDVAIAEVISAGGAERMEARTIPGVGRIGMIADPQGAAVYVMTPEGTGQSTAFAPGVPGHGGWHELRTTDSAAALRFYTEQFGWAHASDMDMGPMGPYRMFRTGGEDAVGGMFDSPDSPRPHWLYYLNVAEIDAAHGRVEAEGGTVLRGPMEVPGGLWVIQGRDPQGALFALVGPRGTVSSSA